ncbi:conserved hypothetical protein [Culex quinquefasciatus]|uniref:Uncharacterized protein n=1 Tax=Culex quinquefasciatus TaxID=7176 RepID=B0WWF1_CULQU|nr:conserved hypothetical protein [Culex quinquefasciatus]|eukprot:XP_001861723.1 conserved hypothetical protein [Culex quinquefasciatus]
MEGSKKVGADVKVRAGVRPRRRHRIQLIFSNFHLESESVKLGIFGELKSALTSYPASIVGFVFKAASLTVTCRQTQSCGHLISIRPFVHRNTSSEELNTVLLYASSLQMSAQLFRVPINAHYLCFLVLVCVIALLTFGMCLSLALGG